MNDKQTKLMWVGIVIIVMMVMFPPWILKLSRGGVLRHGYAPIWLPPQLTGGRSMDIDVTMLSLQIGIVALITGGLMVTKRTKPQAQGGTYDLQQAGSAGPKPPTAPPTSAGNDEASSGDVY